MSNEEAFTQMQILMRKQGLLFDVDNKSGVITGQYLDDVFHRARPTRFELSFQDGYVVNVTSWDLRICASDFSEKAMNVALVNNGLICGNFLLDIVKGQILYKNIMSYTALEHCQGEELERFVSLPTAMFFEHEQRLIK